MRRLLFIVLVVALGPAVAGQRCDTNDFPLSLPTERFEANGDGTVTDRASGLMWMRCAIGQTWQGERCSGSAERFDWAGAGAAADAVNGSGDWFFNDWRVPGLRDLAMVIERQCVNPRTNLTLFPDTPPDFFWTSTLRPGDVDGDAYALSFGPEGVQHRPKSEQYYLRLVRTAAP
jgi:hypothetical protein